MIGLFTFLSLGLTLHLLQSFPLLFQINIIELVSFVNPVFSKKVKQHNVVFFDSFPYPESVTMEASHPEYLEKEIYD